MNERINEHLTSALVNFLPCLQTLHKLLTILSLEHFRPIGMQLLSYEAKKCEIKLHEVKTFLHLGRSNNEHSAFLPCIIR